MVLSALRSMSCLLVLAPLLAGLVWFSKVFNDNRKAMLAASVAWGAMVTVLMESLSALQALTFVPVLLSWTVLTCTSIAVVLFFCVNQLDTLRMSARRWVEFDSTSWVPLVGIGVILSATVLVCLTSAPNNWDSMTYHLSRVANWIDHHSVGHYPTHILRQLYLGPWAEFAITHLQILSGADRFAPFVQYAAMLGSILGVSLVAKKLGASATGQLFASVFCATIPMGVLQGSSTQNDYVTAFWLLCFLAFIVDIINGHDVSTAEMILAGVSLGLAALTKTTALLFAAPFLAAVVIAQCGRGKAKLSMRLLIACGVLAGLLNAPHLSRNFTCFDSALGPRSEVSGLTNATHTPSAIASNLIRQSAMHLAIPRANKIILPFVQYLHSLTGMDINDYRTTIDEKKPFSFGFSWSDEEAGNPLHLCFIVVAIAISFVKPDRKLTVYASCLVAGFIIFCIFIKWQPWISRLHLPLFVAAAPACGVVFGRACSRRVVLFASASLLCVGISYAVRNSSRPLLARSSILFRSRNDTYFSTRPRLSGPFQKAAQVLKGTSPIGFIGDVGEWEYPLRVLIGMAASGSSHLVHVNVQNESKTCGVGDPGERLPDKIVLMGEYPNILPPLPPGYLPIFSSPYVKVYQRAGQ